MAFTKSSGSGSRPNSSEMSGFVRFWSGVTNLIRRNVRFLFLLAIMVLGIHLWQTWSFPSGHIPKALLERRSEWIDPDGRTREASLAEAITALRTGAPGQVVGVHVWAEWCSICKLEESSISRLARDKAVLTVAVQSGSSGRVLEVMRQRELTWPAWVDPEGRLLNGLGLRAVPVFFVVDQTGVIRFPAAGYTTEIGMRARLFLARVLMRV